MMRNKWGNIVELREVKDSWAVLCHQTLKDTGVGTLDKLNLQ